MLGNQARASSAAVAIAAIVCGSAVSAAAVEQATSASSGSPLLDASKRGLSVIDALTFDDGMYHWKPSTHSTTSDCTSSTTPYSTKATETPFAVVTVTKSLTTTTTTTMQTSVHTTVDDDDDTTISHYTHSAEPSTMDEKDAHGEAAVRTNSELPAATTTDTSFGNVLPGIIRPTSKTTETSTVAITTTKEEIARRRGIVYTYTVTAAPVKRATFQDRKAKPSSSASEDTSADAEEEVSAVEAEGASATASKKPTKNKKVEKVESEEATTAESTIEDLTSKGGKKTKDKKPKKTDSSLIAASGSATSSITLAPGVAGPASSSTTVWWTPESSVNNGQWTPRSAMPVKRTVVVEDSATAPTALRRSNSAGQAGKATGKIVAVSSMALLLSLIAAAIM